ncbi:hypothetical protein [Clostridium brassicae]|uniref:Uncharacterized protein n=1 Tax=Clostridium brassicae TaxID=2999072 RepID=A0ABT4D5W4_9CLOT|nr:hypothetical protein [Clostridium brassicae]MCY6957684.1 hypothetical protein [Clostridium brassicae]
MEKFFQYLNNPNNKEKIYIFFVVVGLGLITKTIKRIMDEIKKKK